MNADDDVLTAYSEFLGASPQLLALLKRSVKMNLSRHFDITELVPPETYQTWGERSSWFLDPRAVETLDLIRDRFGPLTCNNWHDNGPLHYRGFRPPGCTDGAPLSQHRYGRAFDVSSATVTAEAMREYILAHPAEFPLLTTIEADTSWLHFDVRWTGQQGILVVHP